MQPLFSLSAETRPMANPSLPASSCFIGQRYAFSSNAKQCIIAFSHTGKGKSVDRNKIRLLQQGRTLSSTFATTTRHQLPANPTEGLTLSEQGMMRRERARIQLPAAATEAVITQCRFGFFTEAGFPITTIVAPKPYSRKEAS